MALRMLMLLTPALLMAPAEGEGGGGGGGGAPPPPAGGANAQQAPAGSPPPTGDGDEKITHSRKELDAQLAERAKRGEKRGREELLSKFKDAGITSEEDLEKLVKAHKDNLEAQKTELQKERERASKAEKDAETAKTEAAAAREEARRIRLFAGAGVKDADVAGFLLDKARAEDKDLDEKKWLGDLKKEKPYLFAEDAPAPAANSGRKPEGGQAPNGGGAPADLSKLSADERRKAAIAAGIDPRLIGA